MTNHPNRANKDPWTSEGSLAAEICSLLGWRESINPIEVRRTDAGVEVRGTALKPSEWLDLCLITGSQLTDGSRLVVCDVPWAVNLERNILVRRKGRFIVEAQ